MPARPDQRASYPISVRQVAVLLRASFRLPSQGYPCVSLILRPIRLDKGLSPPSCQTCSAHIKSLEPLKKEYPDTYNIVAAALRQNNTIVNVGGNVCGILPKDPAALAAMNDKDKKTLNDLGFAGRNIASFIASGVDATSLAQGVLHPNLATTITSLARTFIPLAAAREAVLSFTHPASPLEHAENIGAYAGSAIGLGSLLFQAQKSVPSIVLHGLGFTQSEQSP